jgi:hypothetical protein
MDEFFRVGAAEVDVTPPAGLPMDGYIARQNPSLGAHDPLMAQVVIVEYEGRRAAIIALDTLAVSAVSTQAVRQTLANLLDTSPEAIWVCASHTHCGPQGLQNWFPIGAASPLDTHLIHTIRERVLTAAQTALARLRPARLVYGLDEAKDIGGDRNQPGVPVDTRVTALRFDALDGPPICILFHFACHPTVLGADTLYYSADFPGAARQRIREAYADAICLFLNGALGDVSTRYLRREQSFAEVARLGGLLGDSVLEALQQPQPSGTDLRWACSNVDLPFRVFIKVPPPQTTLRSTDRPQQTRAEGAAIAAQLSAAFSNRTSQRVQLCSLCIGEWVLLGIPGEPFNALATAIHQHSPHALIIGCANDYAGYFPTQTAIEAQTYEALSTPYDARALALIEQRLIHLMQTI